MIAIAAPVAGVFALVVVVLAIFFVVRKNKTYSTAGMYESPDRVLEIIGKTKTYLFLL